jgi:hypothetical protein
MQNASAFLGLSLRYFPIFPAPSVFSAGNRKGEVRVGVGDEAISEQPLGFLQSRPRRLAGRVIAELSIVVRSGITRAFHTRSDNEAIVLGACTGAHVPHWCCVWSHYLYRTFFVVFVTGWDNPGLLPRKEMTVCVRAHNQYSVNYFHLKWIFKKLSVCVCGLDSNGSG